MDSEEIPEDRCGFVLKPEDVTNSVKYTDIEDWYKDSRAVSCWRETWNGTGKCIWHAKSEEKSLFELNNARKDGPERIDGVVLTNLHLEDRLSFEGCTLPSADFSHSDFRNTNFSNSNLFDANFDGANLENANFNNSKLKGSSCKNANLFDADFTEANLQSVIFENSNLNGANAKCAKLQLANLSGADCVHTIFDKANFEKTRFSGVIANSASFKKADLHEADFQCLELRNSDFSNANLSGADLSETLLQDANLEGANLYHANLEETVATDASFTEAYLVDADIKDADFRDADTTGAILEDASIVRTDLRRANFENARLYQIYFLDNRINRDTEFGSICPYEYTDKLNPWDGTSLELETKRWDATTTEASIWTYDFLQSLHEEYGLTEKARKYHIRKKKSQRNRHWEKRNLLQWAFHAGNGIVSKHGESPWRVIETSITTIIIFSLLYPKAGGFKGATDISGTEWLEQFYFSAVTFTTLGYGDLHPATQASRLLASFEAFLGALLMAYLVFVLGRRTNW